LIEDRRALLEHKLIDAQQVTEVLPEPMPLSGRTREIFETALAGVQRAEDGSFFEIDLTNLIADTLGAGQQAGIAIVKRAQAFGGTAQDGWITLPDLP
jgi:hypothetical protein